MVRISDKQLRSSAEELRLSTRSCFVPAPLPSPENAAPTAASTTTAVGAGARFGCALAVVILYGGGMGIGGRCLQAVNLQLRQGRDVDGCAVASTQANTTMAMSIEHFLQEKDILIKYCNFARKEVHIQKYHVQGKCD
uniref:Uncharacterized protein n=1 Tax=Oryza meridionalis TaxID=40149 RepID=A0A0E0EX24_9ORYZ